VKSFLPSNYLRSTGIAAAAGLCLAAPPAICKSENWSEPFYQYRIPLVTETSESGWHKLAIDGQKLTTLINDLEQFKYNPDYIAYNYAKLVEVDESGNVINRDPEAGFYLIEKGENLASNALQEKVQKFPISISPNHFYLLSYESSNGGKSPANGYEQVFEPGHPLRKTDFKTSYFPPLLPVEQQTHEVLFVPDRDRMELLTGGPFASQLHEISVREADISFLAKMDRPGRKHWMLYYQPMCSHHLQIPTRRLQQMPSSSANIVSIAPAQKHDSGLHYRLTETKDCVISYADSTIKLTRDLPPAKEIRQNVAVFSAANERISFQLFIRPRTSLRFESLAPSDLVNEDQVIKASDIQVQRIEYVPIRKSSYITPARYLGYIGDPLVAATSKDLDAASGPMGLWVTIQVPPGTRAGIYKGAIQLKFDKETTSIPVSLKVYDFELPEYSPFRTDMGGQYITKVVRNKSRDSHPTTWYHNVSSSNDIRALARRYYDSMADNKFYPKNVALLEEIGLNWTPPPQGYNVDKPGNFFTLSDWDFTQFNECLRHFIDEKKVNNICIYHTNPTACNLFRQLPGKRLKTPYPYPGHVTMGWQTFRECTTVAYGKIPDNLKDSIIEITQKQWDDLVLKYFRKIAENLNAHGWLDRATIVIDERPSPEQLEHFLKLLKSAPLTARIQIKACIQGLEDVRAASKNGDAGSRFRNLIDVYVPEMDENYDRWMPYYKDDYKISKDRENLQFYIVTTARHAIDTPGINNRVIGLDIFKRGGSGLLYWESLLWDNPYYDAKSSVPADKNPWQDPYGRHSNGALAFFYPPNRTGTPTEKPDLTIIPSLRLEAFRQSINDYEYAYLLENLISKGDKKGVNTESAKSVLRKISDFFPENTNWSQNAWWYLELRKQMAEAIVELRSRLGK